MNNFACPKGHFCRLLCISGFLPSGACRHAVRGEFGPEEEDGTDPSKYYEKYAGEDWREISSEEYDAFETEYDKYMEQYPIKLVEFNLDSIETELASYG